jgi:hypothetical protein
LLGPQTLLEQSTAISRPSFPVPRHPHHDGKREQ